MSTALYRKWRSQSFDEVVGQEHVTQTLRNALREGRVAHAYLFAGPRGTGKTSSARILAKALNCSAPEAERPCNQCPTCIAITEGRMIDLIEIDAASNNGVDDIRELRDKVGFRPSEGRYKIYIIDEVHMLSNSAFNALLKTLEEPPPHARFVLATTEPHKIPATVLSRCQRFDFRRIPAPEIAGHLQHIVAAEGFQADYDALLAIARSAQGCMRDAVSLLDQMLSYGAESVTLQQVQQVLGAVNAQAVAELVDALAAKNLSQGLGLIHGLVTGGASLNEFCAQVVEHLRGIMMLQMTNDPGLLDDLPGESIQKLQQQAKQMPLPATLYAIKRFSEAIPELKGGYQPQLPLELALIEAVQGGPVAPVVIQQVVQQVVQPPPSLDAAVSATPPAGTSAGAGKAGRGAKGAVNAAADGEAAAALPHPEPVKLDAEAARRLQSRWKEFMAQIKAQCGPNLPAALQAVRDIAVSDQSVALAFGNNDFSRNMVAKPENLPSVTAILSTFLGHQVALECQLGEKATLSGRVMGMVEAPTSGPDPLVEFAVTTLGAQVLKENK
jgi:DNA polymerase III subunit gamma/tau